MDTKKGKGRWDELCMKSVTNENLLNALWGPKWEGNL